MGSKGIVMKIARLCLMISMLLFFVASCFVFVVPALSVVRNIVADQRISLFRSTVLLAAELGAASIFALTACAIVMGWRTRNKWGIASSLMSVCVPCLFLYGGIGMFWQYLLACLWPSWLFGIIGLLLFWKAGMPNPLVYDLRGQLGHATRARQERNVVPK